MKKLASLVLALVTTLAGITHGADGFKTGGVILYQTEDVLEARAPDVKELATYAQALEAACHEYFTKEARPKPPFYVLAAVKPGKTSRVWFVTPDAKETARIEPLKKKLEAVPAMAVKEGPVIIGISDEATAKAEGKNSDGPPMPAEWEEAATKAKKDLETPDEILALVWPDTDAQKAATKATTVEYVEQILEPLGGKITKPKAWHYTEGHKGAKFVWTISEQDISNGGSYDTGVRIQAFFKVKENTGKSAKEFLQGFLAAKQEGEGKVLSTCPEKEQGMFTRTCLEMEEGRFHIMYSVFWSDDISVVMISGAPKEQWDRYSPVFNRMMEFQLFDMERIEKDAAKEDAAAKEKK
ncbi:hypothetical protein DES53_11924 [Roseimicrobium gellanilyticum]|uniref:DUF1795 domain-containing protein n=1 Tax=Roseimicrobium gellanilyticum TaxID=748857 RepID=A0A366H3I0_9BACT|nr:hypothetical protein [Roseimicrobium gellanilyticum]RBP35858.1 hypothetical protein DES53_11924 [Roseimicrobium gellanilyticum]